MRQGILTLLVVFLFILSGLLIVIPTSDIIPSASAKSSWVETSDTDFSKGTKSKVEIQKSGILAELILDSNEWGLLKPLTKPGARATFAMSSFYASSKVLLFGGYDKTYDDETWAYDISKGGSWVNAKPKTNPGGRAGHSMASIFKSDNLVMYGGHDGSSYLSDTWVFDESLGDWAQKTITFTTPGRRAYYSMVARPDDDQVMLFGGYDGKSKFDDTWLYDLSDNKWVLRKPATKPTARMDHAMAAFASDDKVLLFGGDTGSLNGDTWVYDFSDDKWVNQNPKVKPRARKFHSMATITKTDKVLLYGGWDGKDNDETWIYDLSDNEWTLLTPYDNPTTKHSHGLAHDWSSDQVLLFGGKSGSTFMSETWIYDHGRFVTSGTFYSAKNDTGGNSSFKKIYWSTENPTSTTIKFQLRTAATDTDLNSKSFVGPGGSNTLYYTTSGSEIWEKHNGDRWVQYRAVLSTTDTSKTPILQDVTISYNRWPASSSLIGPVNKILIKNNKPKFEWKINDVDSKGQSAFQVLIDNDYKFTSVDYDSGMVNSTNTYWQFPANTSYKKIVDGTWFWKVRIKDTDGDWGPYSEYWTVIIDATPPKSFTPTSEPSGWTNNSKPVISFATTDALSGIKYYEVRINDGSFNKQTSPYTLPSLTEGTHNITVRAHDVAGNYIDCFVDVFIDKTAPASFTPEADPSTWTTDKQPDITFSTTDTPSGIDHYEMSVDQGTFSIKSSPATLSPQTDGTHKVTIKAVDLAGNSITGSVNVHIDTSSPSITHTPVTSGTKDFPITITAIIEDEHSGVDLVTLYYKKPKESVYSTKPMTADGNTYSAEISAASVTEEGIEYYLKAIDQSSPPNTIYFGKDGETGTEPAPVTDIDISITLDDVTPPTITHVPILNLTLGDDLIITSTVVDDATGVKYAKLFYKKESDAAYSNISMVKSGNIYSIEVPTDVITNDGLGYYIETSDSAPAPNIAYYGATGQVAEKPDSTNDIDILVLEKDSTPPTIIETSPIGDNVPVGTTILVTFSESMDLAATESVFSINPTLTGSTNWEENKLIFTPDSALEYGTEYDVKVGSNAKDLAGNILGTDTNWQFTTTSVKDTTPPEILDKFPVGLTVHVDTKISVAFNEPMLRQDTESAFSINPNVNGTYQWIGSTLTFTPALPLAYETQYIVNVSTDAKDLVGNNLLTEFIWQFTTEKLEEITEAPTILDKLPIGNNVSVDTTISVAFSELMKKEDTEAAFSIFPVAIGTFYWLGSTLTFIPTSPLEYNTHYNVSISSHAKNLDGINLEEDYRWSFTTGKSEKVDTDGDNILDSIDDDDDNDGFKDEWEIFLGTDTLNSEDSPLDTDHDGAPDGDETNSHQWMDKDDDDDGYNDAEELIAGTDPKNPKSKPKVEDDGDKRSALGLEWDIWEPILTGLTILGTIIVALIGFFKLRKKRSKLQEYIDKIDEIYTNYDKDYKSCRRELIALQGTIKREFKQHKIDDNHFLILDRKINDYLQELKIFERPEKVSKPDETKEPKKNKESKKSEGAKKPSESGKGSKESKENKDQNVDEKPHEAPDKPSEQTKLPEPEESGKPE